MTGIVILAAGSSSRMGKAKQNLIYKGQTLLQTCVNTALQSVCETVIVVLGANANEITPTIAETKAQIFTNTNWSEGMGSSISYGVKEILKLNPALSSIVFILPDQPFIDVNTINTLIKNKINGKIVASAYNNVIGPPVLFDKLFFTDLLAMSGNEGAKKILTKHSKSVVSIPFPDGAFDIDTPEDYDHLRELD